LCGEFPVYLNSDYNIYESSQDFSNLRLPNGLAVKVPYSYSMHAEFCKTALVGMAQSHRAERAEIASPCVCLIKTTAISTKARAETKSVWPG
jgi:hypothetical protein